MKSIFAIKYILDKGRFVVSLLQTFQLKCFATITRSVTYLFTRLYTGAMDIVANRNLYDQSSTDALSSVFSLEALQRFALTSSSSPFVFITLNLSNLAGLLCG